jgi:hypothetical protein
MTSSNRLPIFAKDEDGKWKVFPFELLEDFHGKRCIILYPYENDDIYSTKMLALSRFYHLFGQVTHHTGHPKLYVYPLKDQS